MTRKRAIKKTTINGPLETEGRKKKSQFWAEEPHAFNFEVCAKFGLIDGITNESELVELAWRNLCEQRGLPVDRCIEISIK